MDNAPRFTDTHAHLTHRRFDDDREEMIARAIGAGVDRIITIGTDLESSRRCLELAERHPEIYAAVGIHPCDAQHLNGPDDEWLSQIEEMARHPKAVAIGETGLDHFHPPEVEGLGEEEDRARQIEVFRLQLELAERLSMPVVIHQRECYAPLADVIAPFAGRVRAVFHCWTHGEEEARPFFEAGHFISFTGVVTFKSAPECQAAATAAPAGRYMVETDAPYLSPPPHRGQRCEPAYVPHTAAKIADLRGISLDQVAAETNAAADDLFFKGIA